MSKQLPRTNWEVTITPPDEEPTVLRRRLTTYSLVKWVDDLIAAQPLTMRGFNTRIEVHAITETGERRPISTY